MQLTDMDVASTISAFTSDALADYSASDDDVAFV